MVPPLLQGLEFLTTDPMPVRRAVSALRKDGLILVIPEEIVEDEAAVVIPGVP